MENMGWVPPDKDVERMVHVVGQLGSRKQVTHVLVRPGSTLSGMYPVRVSWRSGDPGPR